MREQLRRSVRQPAPPGQPRRHLALWSRARLRLGDIEPAEDEGSAEMAGKKSTSTRSTLRIAPRRGGFPDVDGVQRDAERAGPVVETGGVCLDPELITKRLGQGTQHERLARGRGEEEGTAGEDHQQHHAENDCQARHRAKSARDEVASLRYRMCHECRPGFGVLGFGTDRAVAGSNHRPRSCRVRAPQVIAANSDLRQFATQVWFRG